MLILNLITEINININTYETIKLYTILYYTLKSLTIQLYLMQKQQSHLMTFSNSSKKHYNQTSTETKTSFKQNSQIIQNNNSTKQKEHSLMYEILQKQKRKTIQHKINQIDTQSTILYKQIVNRIETINHTQHQLTEKSKRYDKKLNNLYYKIKNQFISLKEINQNNIQNLQQQSIQHSLFKPKRGNCQSQSNERNCHKKPEVHTSRQQKVFPPKNRMISVSGVTNYKFKSLLAQRNLIYNPLNSRSSQEDIRLKSNCSINRKNKISYRSVSQKHKQTKQKQIAFKFNLLNKKDRELSTEKYLQKVRIEKRNMGKVYGDEESKLNHISYLMKQMGFEREVALFSTDYILDKIRQQFGQTNTEGYNQILPMRKSTIERDEKELNCRRKIYYKPKRTKKIYQLRDSSKQAIQNNTSTRSAVLLNTFHFVSDY